LILINWVHLLLWYPLPFRVTTCVVDTRQGDGCARIVRATVFERLGDEGMPPSIEYWHGEAGDHRALADKILDQVAAAR
jgi:hypothetical protein